MKFDFSARWPEYSFLFLVIIGFIAALVTKNPILNYLTILVAGLMIGRLLIEKTITKSFFFYFIVSGFVFGYLLGSFNANRVISLLFLIFGVIIGAYILKNKI